MGAGRHVKQRCLPSSVAPACVLPSLHGCACGANHRASRALCQLGLTDRTAEDLSPLDGRSRQLLKGIGDLRLACESP